MAEAPAMHAVPEKEEKQIAAAPKAPLGFMPGSWDDAYRIAKYLAQSDLAPDALRKKEYDLLFVIATGQEFGLNPIQAIREIVIIKGKPYLSALLRIGMVKGDPICEYFRLVESDATKATFETKRKGEGITKLTYTIEQARTQGLVGRKDDKGNLIPDQWNKDPALMLRRRCGSQLADEVYPDVTRGTRDREEIDEQDEREVNPAPLRRVGTMTAPPPPEEAQVVEMKKRKLPPIEDVVEKPTQSEAVKAAGGITNSDMDRGGPPPVEVTTMDVYDQMCVLIKECADTAQLDTLSMNVDQTKFTGDQRHVLGQLLKSRRKALETKK